VLVVGVALGDLEVAVLGGVELPQVFVGVCGRGLARVRAVLVHQDAGEEARRVRELPERWDVASHDADRVADLVEIHDLVEVGDEGVGEDDDRRPRLLGRVEGVDRHPERLSHAVWVEGDRRVVAGRAPLHLHDVALPGHGGHARCRPDPHDVDEDRWHADLLRVADGLLHEAEARPGGGCERLRPRQRGTDDRIGRCDLVLRLEEPEFRMLGGMPRRDVEDLGRRADGIAGVVARTRGQRSAEDGLVPLTELAGHGFGS
jgi:hypothetical protein